MLFLRLNTRKARRHRIASRVHSACAAPTCEALEGRRLLSTYYVSNSGSDSQNGTSSSTPWRTIARVNAANLEPGDIVLFRGGQTFATPWGDGTNKVSNSSFSSGLTSWSSTLGTSSYGPTAADGKMKLSGSSAVARAQTVTTKLKAGQGYTLRVTHKVSTIETGRASAGVDFFYAGAKVGGVFMKLRNTSYTEQARDFVAPLKFDRAVVWVRKDSGSSTVYVDSARIIESRTPLSLQANDAGTSVAPVRLGSYGTGRATIDGGSGSGITVLNAGGIEIKNLRVRGSWDATIGAGGNRGAGIEFVSTLAGDGKHRYIRVRDVDVSGFHWAGIQLEGRLGKAGFADIAVTGSYVHHNGDVGINLIRTLDASGEAYAYEDAYVSGNVTAYNTGLPNKGLQSGSGILVEDTLRARVERNVSYENGKYNRSTSAGPVGIFTANSDNVTIQFNESHHNHTGTTKDGGGIDLDGGVTNSVVQYNFTHDNDGPGLQVAHYPLARPQYGNNVLRYNLTQNDARKGAYGAIHLSGGSMVNNVYVHNNVVYLKAGAAGSSAVAAVKNKGVGSNVWVQNNLLMTEGTVPLISSSSTSGVRFRGNGYWSRSGSFKISWGGSSYSSLSGWRSGSGQERLSDGGSAGYSGDPRITDPGAATTIGDAGKLTSLLAYRPLADSPLINRGAPLAFTSPAAVWTDFWGNIAPDGIYDIGAFEM